MNQKKVPFIFLQASFGHGHLNEKTDEAAKPKLIHYQGFDERELVLGEISDIDRYFPQTTVREAIKQISSYALFDTTANSELRRPTLPTSDIRLSENGGNLTQILNTIKINDKIAYNKIKEDFTQVNTNFKDLDFNYIGGKIELMLEETGMNRSIHVSHISDGTLRFLCLLTILHNSKRGNVVCIDEPEIGLYPDMIGLLGQWFSKMDNNSQWLINTHSDIFLDELHLEQIFVVEKDEENSTQVEQLDVKNFAGWDEEFFPGRMWKSGDLGGNRF